MDDTRRHVVLTMTTAQMARLLMDHMPHGTVPDDLRVEGMRMPLDEPGGVEVLVSSTDPRWPSTAPGERCMRFPVYWGEDLMKLGHGPDGKPLGAPCTHAVHTMELYSGPDGPVWRCVDCGWRPPKKPPKKVAS